MLSFQKELFHSARAVFSLPRDLQNSSITACQLFLTIPKGRSFRRRGFVTGALSGDPPLGPPVWAPARFAPGASRAVAEPCDPHSQPAATLSAPKNCCPETICFVSGALLPPWPMASGPKMYPTQKEQGLHGCLKGSACSTFAPFYIDLETVKCPNRVSGAMSCLTSQGGSLGT